MKKQYINILIVVASIAVIGLIGIQFYWVDNAISLKEDNFKRNANEALTEVAKKLEKEEAMNHLKTHQQGRYLFIDSDAEEKINTQGGDGEYDYKVIKQFNKDGDNIDITITEEEDGKTLQQKSTHIENGDTSDMGVFSMDLKYKTEAGDPYLTSMDKIQLNKKVRDKMVQKKAFVGDIVKSLMEVNLFEPIEKRIKINLLDSFLLESLRDKEIHTAYEFGVYDHNGRIRLSNFKGEGHKKLEMTTIQTDLFPNDVIGDPYYLKVYFPKQTSFLLKTNWIMLASSALIVLVIIYVFYWNLMTIINQKRNSEIKNDFINNMTHEFKTPISTISLACEALKDPDIGSNPTLVNRYIGMVNEENKRLGLLVEEVLQSAVLDKGEFKLKLENLEVNNLINSIVDKVEMKVKEKNGTIITNLKAHNTLVSADPVHLANVLYNLIDNANKYSKEQPEITIETEQEDDQLVITVKDKGIGISKENQKKVFDRLYRVPTGNLHDVKGFGLGLSYVKIIVERLGGFVTVKSQLGKGSIFKVYLPLHGKI